MSSLMTLNNVTVTIKTVVIIGPGSSGLASGSGCCFTVVGEILRAAVVFTSNRNFKVVCYRWSLKSSLGGCVKSCPEALEQFFNKLCLT